MPRAPILDKKMIREAGRQKGLAAVPVPPVCILDPDGDLVRRVRVADEAKRFEAWPRYHSELFTFSLAGQTVRIVGCAVGASYAVLIAKSCSRAVAAIWSA